MTKATSEFPISALCANPMFYRSYSRVVNGKKERYEQMCDRTIKGLVELGKLTKEEANLIDKLQRELITTSSGRWMWVGGTEWSKQKNNTPGNYNCSSQFITSWHSIASMMDLAAQGCGTGCSLELPYISQLPAILHTLELTAVGEYGSVPKADRKELTELEYDGETATIIVGDSRKGWVDSYRHLFELAACVMVEPTTIKVTVDVSNVRAKGEELKGFGGTANPTMVKDLYAKIVKILNGAVGRKLTSVEITKTIDEAALTIVVGNIRRSAGMRQFSAHDPLGATAKDNLWIKDEATGKWSIDPDRDCLRMANHTSVYHQKPSYDTVLKSVTKQYHSGEGAIQWAGEAVARANADLLDSEEKRKKFLKAYNFSFDFAKKYLASLGKNETPETLEHRIKRYGLNPCGEIILADSFCNLSAIHANRLDPLDFGQQDAAFKAGALIVAALLHHDFEDDRFQYSREIDPIVGVSVTGIFDFFVNLFGVNWLRWWESGRPTNWTVDRKLSTELIDRVYGACAKHNVNMGNQVWQYSSDMGVIYTEIEQFYLSYWKQTVATQVEAYCHKHEIRVPNRYTTVQPHGSVALLTNSSPGWHPPKAQRYIRRMTFDRNNPVALACIDMGYNVIPSQLDRDEKNNILTNPYDERCTEWLIEFPIQTDWADLPGCDDIDISKFGIKAQYSFYMQVQKHYVGHNTSATLEVRESEIETLSNLIHKSIENDEGYISAALLARFDDKETFPRLPFEPIDKATFKRLSAEVGLRAKTEDFDSAIAQYWNSPIDEVAPAGCDSDKCTLPLASPDNVDNDSDK